MRPQDHIKDKGKRLSNPVAKEYFDDIWKAIEGKYDDMFDMVNLTIALTMMITAIQESMTEFLQDCEASDIGSDAFHDDSTQCHDCGRDI